ncbi:MAG: YicC family protein [Firmicutes bacterium]|nr:YicC family protein [Bacillota bacterium]
MIKSMTGFGQGEASNQEWSVKVEMKSVNHRYLDLWLRIPKQYSLLEEPIRMLIQEEMSRGRVEVSVNIEEFGDRQRNVRINKPLLNGYLAALETIQQELGIKESIQLDHILQLPDLLELEEPDVNWDSLQETVLKAVRTALDELEAMRRNEGYQLSQDILMKISLIERHVDRISEIAPAVVQDYRERLKERLGDLLDGTTITEERFVGEVALFADKCSIDEELVRLRSHIQQFRQSIEKESPVGRKLDFLLQEMNREINTIGSKGNNVGIAGLVVDVKSELEKIREQVQNIE